MREITILADQLESLLQADSDCKPSTAFVRFLSRSRHNKHRKISVRELLFQKFGLSDKQGAAPFNMLGDGLEPGNKYCIHADPVCLYVDLARVFITWWGATGLSNSELADLTSELQSHFQSEGMQLLIPGKDRWYLSGTGLMEAGFPAPEDALGRDIGELLPTGPGSDFWKTRLNECQMILHRNPVNERLTSDGQPAINSVWFWGGGILPEVPDWPMPSVVPGADNLLQGLAQWAGVHTVDTVEEMFADEIQTEGLIVLSPGKDRGRALEDLQALISSLLDALKCGQIERITLLGSQNSLHLGRKDWRAFWRRRSVHQFAGITK